MMLLLYLLFSIFVWIEPSILYRIILSINPETSITIDCTILPWWWISKHETEPHGWASRMDFLQFLGILSIFLIFLFMKQEFNRNKREWIWFKFSQIQNTFDL